MARQKGITRIRGTLYGLTYYRLKNVWLVRQKSSLDRARVMHDLAFAKSRTCAGRFGYAARIAGIVYRMLPHSEQQDGLIGELTGLANKLLFTGDTPAVLEVLLLHTLGPSAREKLLKVELCDKESPTSLSTSREQIPMLVWQAKSPAKHEFALPGVP